MTTIQEQIRREKEDACPECGGQTTETTDNIVCRECGLVIRRQLVDSTYLLGPECEHHVDGTTEYRQAISPGQRENIVDGLGTKSRPAAGWHVRASRREYQVRSTDKLYLALRQLNRITGMLTLPDIVRDRAAQIVRMFLGQIRNTSALVYVAILRACKEYAVYVDEKQLRPLFPIFATSKRNRMMMMVQDKLGPIPTRRAEFYLPQIQAALSVPEIFDRLAKKGVGQDYIATICSRTREILTSLDAPSRALRPMILAASCVCYVDSISEHALTQQSIAKAAGVAEYSIRDHINIFWKKRSLNEP